MLMKLLLPREGDLASVIHAGRIVKWHKKEGEWVNYGDDLFDFWVEEASVTERSIQLGTEIRDVNERPTQYAELAARQLSGPNGIGEELRQERLHGCRTTPRIDQSKLGDDREPRKDQRHPPDALGQPPQKCRHARESTPLRLTVQGLDSETEPRLWHICIWSQRPRSMFSIRTWNALAFAMRT